VLDIGKLRKRLTLQRRSWVQDPTGEPIEIWQDIGDRWGAIRGMDARERVTSQAVHNEDTHEITMRYRPGLLAEDRVRYIDDLAVVHLYNITAVQDEDELHKVTTCTAVEGLAPG
jgi:SPP1 family predicted phage head-tail adaptor